MFSSLVPISPDRKLNLFSAFGRSKIEIQNTFRNNWENKAKIKKTGIFSHKQF